MRRRPLRSRLLVPPVQAQAWAARLVATTYGADGAQQSATAACELSPPSPVITCLTGAARRIARNALRATLLTTDSLGTAVLAADGTALGHLWTYCGDDTWLSVYFTALAEAAPALAAWGHWAHDGAPPFRVSLQDARVPLLGRMPLGLPARLPGPRPCPAGSPEAAGLHAAVVSLVETCRRQGRDPCDFIAALLAQHAVVDSPTSAR